MIYKATNEVTVEMTQKDSEMIISKQPHLLYKISDIVLGGPINEFIEIDTDECMCVFNYIQAENTIYVAIFPKAQTAFSDEIEHMCNNIMERFLQNIVIYGHKIWFDKLSYTLIYKYENGKKRPKVTGKSSWYIVDIKPTSQDELQNVLTGHFAYTNEKMNKLLKEISAIVTIPDCSSRYLLLYEMLYREHPPLRSVDQYILNCGLDVSKIKFYTKGSGQAIKGPYGVEIRHNKTSHLTVLRNALVHHDRSFFDNRTFLELESDIWQHTRPLLNILTHSIISNSKVNDA